jgi:hypothetical protein
MHKPIITKILCLSKQQQHPSSQISSKKIFQSWKWTEQFSWINSNRNIVCPRVFLTNIAKPSQKPPTRKMTSGWEIDPFVCFCLIEAIKHAHALLVVVKSLLLSTNLHPVQLYGIMPLILACKAFCTSGRL